MPVILMIPTFNDGVHSVQKLENLAIQIQELALRLHKFQNFVRRCTPKIIDELRTEEWRRKITYSTLPNKHSFN